MNQFLVEKSGEKQPQQIHGDGGDFGFGRQIFAVKMIDAACARVGGNQLIGQPGHRVLHGASIPQPPRKRKREGAPLCLDNPPPFLISSIRERCFISFMNSETSQRLERLEAHVAHLERQVEQLNDVIIEQGKLVGHLKKQVQAQSATMETLELERIKTNNPKPPHYQ